MTTGPQRPPDQPYFRKLYGQRSPDEQPFSIPFSSPQSFQRFASERIATRHSVNKQAEAATAHIDTDLKYEKKMDTYGMTRSESEADFSGQEAAQKDKAVLHAEEVEKISRTLAPEQTMRLYVTPEEHRASITHSTDLNGSPATSLDELRQLKKREASRPAGRGHGSGLLDALRSGETIRNPVRVIVGQPDRVIQHEGHHRVEAVAEHEAETGERQLIPVELHSGVWSSQIAEHRQRMLDNARAAKT